MAKEKRDPKIAHQKWAEWYAANRDTHNARRRARRAANHDAALANDRAWKEAHAEYVKQRTHDYHAAHPLSPARKFAAGANKYVRQRLGRSEPLDWKNLPDGPCAYCGRDDDAVSWDHVIPLSRGGANHSSNCVRCCMPCNMSKNAKTPEEWAETDRLSEETHRRRLARNRDYHRAHADELRAKRLERRERSGHW